MSARDGLAPPHVEKLTPYVPGKPLEELERELGIRNAIKLASNENPVGPSPRALEAAAQALRDGNRYPDNYKLRAALAAHHGVALEEVTLGNGSNELIDLIARAFAVPGGHAVYPDPSFVCYRSSTTATAMDATEVPLIGHVAYDIDALIAAVRPDTRLFFLANPNNPTGAYVGRTDLERILRALPERTIAVLDEAYVEFPDASDYASALQLRGLHENTIVLRTFSKAYGMAAFRVGYAIAPAHLIGYVERVRAPFNVGSASLAAAIAALADPEHVQRYVELNRSERSRVTRELTALGFKVAPSQANFVLVDFARLGTKGGVPDRSAVTPPVGKEVYDRLLRKGVIVRPVPPPITSWLRITIGLPAENERLFAALREIVEEGR